MTNTVLNDAQAAMLADGKSIRQRRETAAVKALAAQPTPEPTKVQLPDGSQVDAALVAQIVAMVQQQMSEAHKLAGGIAGKPSTTKGTPVVTKGKGAPTETKRVPSKRDVAASLTKYHGRLVVPARRGYLAAWLTTNGIALAKVTDKGETIDHAADEAAWLAIDGTPDWVTKIDAKVNRYGAPHYGI